MNAEVNKPGTRGLAHIMQAAGYSMSGLRAAVTHEEAFRLELMAMIVLLPLAIWLGQSGIEYALLIGSLLLVLIVELINSALEAVVDRVGVEHHELSGRAKDIGSAAVFVALMNVLIVWTLLLGERLLIW
jgi:diacylglycerol kinase (ATP)